MLHTEELNSVPGVVVEDGHAGTGTITPLGHYAATCSTTRVRGSTFGGWAWGSIARPAQHLNAVEGLVCFTSFRLPPLDLS